MTLEPPTELRERFADAAWDMVWSMTPQIETWRIEPPDGAVMFLKLVDHAWDAASVADEAARLRWAGERLPVPRVLETGCSDRLDWMLTQGLPGRNAIDPELMSEPGHLTAAMGRGLCRFHQASNAGCPFDARNDALLERLRAKVPPSEYEELAALRPNTEDLVLTHGDACLPNFLIEDWEVTGYVDLGDLAVADRWRDIAVCLWSLGHNLGQGWDEAFLEGYGIERDERRVAFYQGLYWKL